MSLLTSASTASAWRGYEYYEQRKNGSAIRGSGESLPERMEQRMMF